MDITISSSLVEDYLLIKITGSIENLDEMKSLTKQIYEEIIRHDRKKVIIDQTGNQPTKSLVNITELVKFYSEELPVEIRRLKIAVVTDNTKKEIANFWETYSSNRGFPAKVFFSMDEAREFISG